MSPLLQGHELPCAAQSVKVCTIWIPWTSAWELSLLTANRRPPPQIASSPVPSSLEGSEAVSSSWAERVPSWSHRLLLELYGEHAPKWTNAGQTASLKQGNSQPGVLMSGSHQTTWIPCFYHVDSLSLEEWLLSFKIADIGGVGNIKFSAYMKWILEKPRIPILLMILVWLFQKSLLFCVHTSLRFLQTLSLWKLNYYLKINCDYFLG